MFKTSQSFIFIGRSGCGKGTQVELLMKLLKKKDPAREILYIQSGQELRDFMKGPSVTQKICKQMIDDGKLLPEFVVVYLWAQVLIDKFTGNEHLVFDGMPRKIHEAGALNSIFAYYNLPKPWVFYIDISKEEAIKRMLARGRFDDKKEEIEKRLGWYETQVVPTIEYYKDNPDYNFLDINGERSVEEVHADIVKMVGLV
ncbi:MAG: nucleoside monophosphate kinase [Patescibacteria group bacterium]